MKTQGGEEKKQNHAYVGDQEYCNHSFPVDVELVSMVEVHDFEKQITLSHVIVGENYDLNQNPEDLDRYHGI